MRLMTISDLHGNRAMLGKIITLLQEDPVDALLFAGDLTNFGDRTNAQDILDELQAVAPEKTFLIHGNCDGEEVITAMRESGWYVHREKRLLDNLAVIGYGDVPPTPFGTLNEVPDEETGAVLNRLIEPDAIFLAHGPAHGINDQVPSGFHAGSAATLEAIQQKRPRIMLHGHIHEAHAVTIYDYDRQEIISEDKLSSAGFEKEYTLSPSQGLIINLAAAKDGRVNWLTMGEKIGFRSVVFES